MLNTKIFQIINKFLLYDKHKDLKGIKIGIVKHEHMNSTRVCSKLHNFYRKLIDQHWLITTTNTYAVLYAQCICAWTAYVHTVQVLTLYAYCFILLLICFCCHGFFQIAPKCTPALLSNSEWILLFTGSRLFCDFLASIAVFAPTFLNGLFLTAAAWDLLPLLVLPACLLNSESHFYGSFVIWAQLHLILCISKWYKHNELLWLPLLVWMLWSHMTLNLIKRLSWQDRRWIFYIYNTLTSIS